MAIMAISWVTQTVRFDDLLYFCCQLCFTILYIGLVDDDVQRIDAGQNVFDGDAPPCKEVQQFSSDLRILSPAYPFSTTMVV